MHWEYCDTDKDCMCTWTALYSVLCYLGEIFNMKKYLSSHSYAAYSSTTHQPGLIL